MDLETKTEIVRALRSVWDIVGDDCLKLAENQGDGRWTATMTAEEVRCISADAAFGSYEPKACAIFRELSRKEKDELLKEAFPDMLYGY